MENSNPVPFPVRKPLVHTRAFGGVDAVYFVTVCAAQRGVNTPARTDIAPELWRNICFCHARGDWFPHLILVMPDHIHGLFSFPPEADMRSVFGAWKRFTAHELGLSWQRDFFDHRLRQDDSYEEKATYIRRNPVRAGLIGSPEEWPFVWQMNRYG